MWHVIIIKGVGEICVEGRPWMCFAIVINHLRGCFHPLVSLSHACTTPHCRLPVPFILLILRLMCSLSNIRGSRKEIKARIWRKAGDSRISPPSREDQRSGPFESNTSFVSIQEMKWENWAGARAALGTWCCSPRQKPRWCQVRSSNCYQMYNYNHLQPPRPFWWAKKRGR